MKHGQMMIEQADSDHPGAKITGHDIYPEVFRECQWGMERKKL